MRPLFFLLASLFYLVALSAQLNQGVFTTNPPLPEQGLTYPEGTTVEMCFTFTEFQITSNAWLHAIIPNFGPGFDAASIQPTVIPSACNDDTSWGFFDEWESCNTGLTFGPGFAVESPGGTNCGGTPNDQDPGNNWGDGPVFCDRTWCWQIVTTSIDEGICIDSAYRVGVTIADDGISGSWQVPSFFPLDVICNQPIPIVDILVSPIGDSGSFFVEAIEADFGPCDAIYSWRGANIDTITEGLSFIADTAGLYFLDINLGICGDRSIRVNIDPPPPDSINFTASNSSICSGDTYSLTATGGTSYLFFSSTGQHISSDTSTIQLDADTTGTISWIVQVFNGSDLIGSASLEVLVIPPIPRVISLVPDSLQVGDTLLAFVNDLGPGSSYSWLLPNDTLMGDSIVLFPDSSGIIPGNLITVDSNGCSSLDTFQFSVFDAPLTPSVALSVFPNDSLCFEETFILTAHLDSAESFRFIRPDGVIIFSDSSAIVEFATPEISGDWQVLVFDAQGELLDSTTISIWASEEVVPSVSLANGEPIFPNAQVILSGMGGGDSGSYDWEVAGLSSTSNPFQFPAPSVGTYLGTLDVINNFGCTGQTDFSFTVSAPPVEFGANIFPEETICFGEAFTISATEGFSYIFEGPAGQVIPSNNNELALIAEDFTRGEWKVIGISDGVPFDTTCLTAMVADQIFPEVSTSPSSLTQGTPANFEGFGGGANASYEWIIGGDAYFGNPVLFIPPSGGSLTGSLRVTDSNGCTASTNFSFFVTFSNSPVITPILIENFFPFGQDPLTENDGPKNGLLFFPNPTSEFIKVRPQSLTKYSTGNLSVLIRDQKGKLLIRKLFKNDAQDLTIRVNNLPAGLYYCTIQMANGEQFTEKIVIHTAVH